MNTNCNAQRLRLAHDAIWEMPEPLGLYAGQLYGRGEQFLSAFDVLSAEEPIKLPYAAYFNLQHAVELLFKAYLAAHGTPKADLKKQLIRHDLEKLFDLCRLGGAPVTTELGYLARDLQENSRHHDFRYPTSYNLRVPSRRLVVETIHPFCEAIRPLVSNAALEAQLQYASDTRHLQGSRIRWSD